MILYVYFFGSKSRRDCKCYMNSFQEEVRGRRQVREGGGFKCGESEDEGKAEEEDGRRYP